MGQRKKQSSPGGYSTYRARRPHFAVTKILGWAPDRMRMFMLTRGLKTGEATVAKILPMLVEAGVKLPEPQRKQLLQLVEQERSLALPLPPAALPAPKSQDKPPGPPVVASAVAKTNGSTPPTGLVKSGGTRPINATDVKLAISALEGLERAYIARVGFKQRLDPFESEVMSAVARALEHLSPERRHG